MKDSALNRWMWLIGLVAVALIFVSFGPFSSGQPNENASGVSVAHWYNTHVNRAVGHDLDGRTGLVSAAGLRHAAARRAHTGWRSTKAVAEHRVRFDDPVHRGHHRLGQFHDDALPGVAQPPVRHRALHQLLPAEQRATPAGRHGLPDPSAGLAILLNRGANPLPKRLGWYSILVAVVGMAARSASRFPLRVPDLDPGYWHRDRGQAVTRHAREVDPGGAGGRLGRRPRRSPPSEDHTPSVRVVQPSPRTISPSSRRTRSGSAPRRRRRRRAPPSWPGPCPAEPEMMAPAWPILRPGGAVTPAM